MSNIKDKKNSASILAEMFKKLSVKKQERVLGYLEGISAHSNKNSKSA